MPLRMRIADFQQRFELDAAALEEPGTCVSATARLSA